jgi:hypothetical protein
MPTGGKIMSRKVVKAHAGRRSVGTHRASAGSSFQGGGTPNSGSNTFAGSAFVKLKKPTPQQAAALQQSGSKTY